MERLKGRKVIKWRGEKWGNGKGGKNERVERWEDEIVKRLKG